MSSNEARQIVEEGLERKKMARAQRDAILDEQERLLRMTINDNHLVATITEEQKKLQQKEAARKQREEWAKKQADRVARDMAAEQAVNVYGAVCLVIILVAAIFRMNFFVSLALVLGMAAVFAAYVYRIYVPFKKGGEEMKTKEQRKLIRKHRKMPLFWMIVNDKKDHLLVMNWLTGGFRVLDK